MKKAASKTLSRKQKAELKALASMPDDAIDMSDILEETGWTGARRGAFYREYAGKTQRQARGK